VGAPGSRIFDQSAVDAAAGYVTAARHNAANSARTSDPGRDFPAPGYSAVPGNGACFSAGVGATDLVHEDVSQGIDLAPQLGNWLRSLIGGTPSADPADDMILAWEEVGKRGLPTYDSRLTATPWESFRTFRLNTVKPTYAPLYGAVEAATALWQTPGAVAMDEPGEPPPPPPAAVDTSTNAGTLAAAIRAGAVIPGAPRIRGLDYGRRR
jgi:hypothetical protein